MISFERLKRFAAAAFIAGAMLHAQDPVSFTLSLSASAGGSSTLYRQEPLIVKTLLLLESGAEALIAVKDGQKWDSALTLSLFNSKGAELPAPWVKLGATLDPLAFSEDATEASALFGLPAEAINSLPAGDYMLAATFQNDDSAAAGSWKGRLTARITISASDAPRPDSPQSKSTTSRLRARWLQLNGQKDEALAELHRALENDPNDIQTLIDKADLLAELGRAEEAVAILTQAIDIFKVRNPGAKHPPRELLRRLSNLDPL